MGKGELENFESLKKEYCLKKSDSHFWAKDHHKVKQLTHFFLPSLLIFTKVVNNSGGHSIEMNESKVKHQCKMKHGICYDVLFLILACFHWLSHLYHIVPIQIGSCHHNARKHKSQSQTEAPAPHPRLMTHRHHRLRVLQDKSHTNHVHKYIHTLLKDFLKQIITFIQQW